MHIEAAGISLDFSRQRLTREVWEQLSALALESDLMAQAKAMFDGAPINATENRPALHVALRVNAQSTPYWGHAITQDVLHERGRMLALADQIRAGALRGFGGDRITDVVNLGIGGSDLGPRMATQALAPQQDFPPPVRVHFVLNVDAWSLHETLRALNPASTLFVVQSKTFTTQETMTLAASSMRWLSDGGCPSEALNRHRVAVTAKPELARSQGFSDAHILKFWDWVGGRYSVWSSIGFPMAVAMGGTAFQEFLDGAQAMDQHFLSAPLNQNLPVVMALCGIWNRNFLGATSYHIAPYLHALRTMPAHIQQLDMESNGKHTHRDGHAVEMDTAPIIWGGVGLEGQHAYFQLIHQGTHLVPIDFIGVRNETLPMPLAETHLAVVNTNLQAQAQAFALGRTPDEALAILRTSGMDETQALSQLHHHTYGGNIPSNLIWMNALTPGNLGALMALYEHKVFCQSTIWRINPFDQWGVELGKAMVRDLEKKNKH